MLNGRLSPKKSPEATRSCRGAQHPSVFRSIEEFTVDRSSDSRISVHAWKLCPPPTADQEIRGHGLRTETRREGQGPKDTATLCTSKNVIGFRGR